MDHQPNIFYSSYVIITHKMITCKKLIIILVLCSGILNSVNCEQDSPSVIIVGAGASGIAAASRLFQNGFKNITILEAEDRIGGRVYTTRFDDYLVDMGAQYVHGEVGNVAFELAWPLGLLEKGYYKNLVEEIYDSSGTLIDQTVTNDIKKFFFQTGENLKKWTGKANRSSGEFFHNELAKYFEEHPNWNKTLNGVLLLLEMMQMGEDGGDTWWDVSSTSNTEFHVNEGDFLVSWKERGYGTILDILMKRYPNPEEELPIVENTILNAEVSLIKSNLTSGKSSVTTTKGNVFFADHVIVTSSLGVLKENYNTLFQPPLSSEKVKTIKALGFGSDAKIYLSFEKPWWGNDNKSRGFALLWTDEDIAKLENDPEKNWLLGLVGFFFVPHRPRLLYGWISGKYSREMEKLSEQQVFNHSVEVLQRFLGKSYNITKPTGMIRSSWNSNKNFKGTYSFRSMKSDADNVWHATLAEPIGDKKPIVLFAGEATSPHYFSTVHGAISTGWREADRLIKSVKS